LPNETAQNQKRDIRALFTRIARSYDLVNRVIALGQDQRWRRVALDCANLPPGGTLLDVAAGTGDLAMLAQRLPEAPWVVASDLTPAMLRVAQAKASSLPLAVSDGLALSFPDNSFDAATSAFMMRNVPSVVEAFCEQARVVKPGGKVVCLEMTWPRHFPMSWLFKIYFFGLPPVVGKLVAGEDEPYRYLPRSVKRFLAPPALAEIMVRAGLHDVSWRTMMLGTVAIHVGTK
jgi:demethylmenaquinone methyltransferase / 2-methoxy-6-polyprenyl-1,4-benzoquinol methylase